VLLRVFELLKSFWLLLPTWNPLLSELLLLLLLRRRLDIDVGLCLYFMSRARMVTGMLWQLELGKRMSSEEMRGWMWSVLVVVLPSDYFAYYVRVVQVVVVSEACLDVGTADVDFD